MRWHMELEQFYCIECIDSSEKPIGFVSPSKTKRKYPQIEKGLSCVLGVKKLHCSLLCLMLHMYVGTVEEDLLSSDDWYYLILKVHSGPSL